jgi:hypothetical protein
VNREAGASGERNVSRRPSSEDRSEAAPAGSAESSSNRSSLREPSDRTRVSVDCFASSPVRFERRSSGSSQTSGRVKYSQ